jgi:hypothetical protein
MRDDIIFVTLCICGTDLDAKRIQFKGTLHYFETCNILIHSVLKNTHSSIIVVTDSPQLFLQHERVIVKNIYDLTDEPLLKGGYMNFHLKRFAMNEGFLVDKKYVLYIDCDVFFEYFHYELLHVLDNVDCDIIGRLGSDPLSSHMNDPWLQEKIQQIGVYWSDDLLNATLPHETVLMFKSDTIKQTRFIEFWNNLANEMRSLDISTHRDSFYIGTSAKTAGMREFNLTTRGTQTTQPDIDKFWDGLRIIHSDHINTMHILPLEVYNYEFLLARMM